MSEDWRDQLEQAGYKFEFDYGYWDYDWSRTLVYTRDGRVIALSDSGCSCKYLGEDFTADNVESNLVQIFDLPGLTELADQHYGHSDGDAFSIQEQYRALGLR